MMKRYRQWYQAQNVFLRLLIALIELLAFYLIFDLIFQQSFNWTGTSVVILAFLLSAVVIFFKIKIKYAWLLYFLGGMLACLLLFSQTMSQSKLMIFSILAGVIMSLVLTIFTLSAYEQINDNHKER
ncbi:hypothetical protein [Bombilactobacillus bombi]|nr:hypothetical protein [Bombilactobacillus bombi]